MNSNIKINNLYISEELLNESHKNYITIDPKKMKKIIGKITELREKINTYFQVINRLPTELNNKYINTTKNMIKNYGFQNYNQYISNIMNTYQNIIKYTKKYKNFINEKKYSKINGRDLVGFINYASELLEFKDELKKLYDKYYNFKNKINKKLQSNIANVNTNTGKWNFNNNL